MQREIATYCALATSFEDFIEPGELTDEEIALVCTKKTPAIPEKKWVPSYTFEIRKGGARVGETNLRIGYTEGLYFGGQIGYHIDEAFRGHDYAGKACRLLIPVMRAHGMDTALITNNVNNVASRRVCEKLGARLVRKAELPEWHDLYKAGERYVNVFEWRFA